MNKQLLEELCSIDAVSGRERPVREYILDYLMKLATPMETKIDPMGNLLVHVKGKEPANKVVMFDAHMDEVGFIITHICDNGYLRFATVGGIDPQVLYGHRVRIGNHIGIICGKACHQCHGDEAKKVPGIDKMVIDIGVSSGDDARKIVKVGDTGTFDANLTWMNDEVFYGKALDDRLGCMLLIEMAETQPDRDIWLSFSVQEEVGLRGAGAAAESIRPDYAVAIETTTAADTAGNSDEEATCFMGKGAVVSFADRATYYDSDLYQYIRSIADDAQIPNQTKNRVVGGNNSGAIQTRATGTKMAAISLPCRYIHSQACMGKVSDVKAMSDIMHLLAKELTK